MEASLTRCGRAQSEAMMWHILYLCRFLQQGQNNSLELMLAEMFKPLVML
jgi:hypothetical protein